MQDDVAALVAFVAARLITGKDASAVYDYGRSGYRNISGHVSPTTVNVYDHEAGAHFGGSGTANDLSLYHYGHSHHVSLKVSGDTFEGYDYGSSCHFSGMVSGSSISLYDYGTGSHRSYSI